MNLLEFAKKYTVFKPPLYHEAFLKMIEDSIEKDKGVLHIDISKHTRWYKRLHLNEFLYSYLTNMVKDQTFALATTKGICIFKMIKFESYHKDEEQLTQQKEKDNGKKQD